MNIKLLADAKYDGVHHQVDDEFNVDCITGIAWCNAGIAVDLDGVLPTALVTLEVQNGQIGVISERI